MPSLQRSPKGSPPKRAALHERTDSQVNERSLRMIGEPLAPSYPNPFPTKPSQILSPKGYTIQGSLARPEPGVSDGRPPTNEPSQHAEGSSNSLCSQVKRANVIPQQPENASSWRQSSADNSFYTPETSKSAVGASTTFPTAIPQFELEESFSDDIVQLPSVPPSAEPLAPFTLKPLASLGHQPVQEKDSESSLSSSNSTGTVIVKKNPERRKRGSYSAFPAALRPNSSKSNSPTSMSQKFQTQKSNEPPPLDATLLQSHPTDTSTATSVKNRTSSAPMYANFQAASQTSLSLQYPEIRPPSASASWVEPPTSVLETDQRAGGRNLERWNPHLSTVHSEGTASQSEGRSSQSTWFPDSSRVSKSSSMAFTGRGSPDQPSIPTSPPSQSPQSFQHRNSTGSTIRIVNEQKDTGPKLQPIPGSRGSEFLGVPPPPEDVRPNVVARPGSRASFFRDSFPAWAKAYYARPHSSSSVLKSSQPSRPTTSTDNISLNVFWPRTRNNREVDGQPEQSSLAIGPVSAEELNRNVASSASREGPALNWSPHLWHDRTSLGRRRTIFQAPSIGELAEGNAPSKRNAQILLFVIGFLIPPAWIIASFLPLPARPDITSLKGKNSPRRAQVIEDLEKQVGPIDEARYENARWWRNINRILSLLGIVIVVAVITVATVTAE